MDNAAVELRRWTVTRTVPGSISVVPRHGTAFMGARRRSSMGYAIAPFHTAILPRPKFITAPPPGSMSSRLCTRLAVAALIEFSWDFSHGVVDTRPMGRSAEDLLSDQNSGRGAIAYAPGVEPSGDVEARRFRQCAGKWNAVSGIVVLVDPPPGDVADLEISPGPRFEIPEILATSPS